MSSPDASDLRSMTIMDPHLVDKDKESVKIELQHFAHPHLLLYGDADTETCALCNLQIRNGDGMYSCKKCYFFIHKSCAEEPRYIRNSLHPMHPLELFSRQKYRDQYIVFPECKICALPIFYLGYKCSSSTTVCDFNLHIKCATESTFDPKDHQHSFINLKPTLFTCDACGIDQDTKCFSCICSICQLQVHLTCHQKFPHSGRVKQSMHAHELKLCYSFEIDYDFSNKSCKICSKKMNNVLCLYQCNKKACASYIAHISCATSEDYWMENIESEEEEEIERKETEPEEVITHFSHPHSLIFSNIEPTYEVEHNDAICYGCVRPIFAPFYTCDSEKCNFFLHKQCFELPKTIRCPIHKHPLVLKDYLDFNMANMFLHGFTCDACHGWCNGFAYKCSERCWKNFDVGCALFRHTLNHASHKCPLTLVSLIPNEENRCIACDSTFSTAFWCEDCKFFLDLKCASLPQTIGHGCPTGTVWTVKPRKLTYDCIEHVGGQYICDLCEETRGKDLWFYYCEDCRESIHPQCLLGDDRFMYGKSYNIDGHSHTVCVEKKPKTDPLCDTCGKPCQDSPLIFCPTCKVYIHDDLKCCGMLPSSRSKPIRNYYRGVSSSPNENEDEDGEIEIRSEIVVNHFSHPHNLVIGEFDPKRLDVEVCDGCGMQITVPFYRCADKKGKCNFFLHRVCFELPKQIQHLLHPDHPLVLNSFLDFPCNDEVAFICYGCDASSNGFFYTCLACKFFLDVRCSLLSDTLVHVSHPCTLTLIDKKKELAKGERKCQACNSDCSSCKYICDECNFELGLRCVSLLKVVMHKCSEYGWNIRPRYLMCATIEDQDGSRKYYCDTCYESRGNGWYYYCKDCDHSTHVGCSPVRTNLIKSGIAYQALNHFHDLITFEARGAYSCEFCRKGMDSRRPHLYCATCNFYFHVKCCRGLRRA